MNRHLDIHCEFCKIIDFTGHRYKCLLCFDYNLCGTCYEAGYTNSAHLQSHPMQCILTKSDFDLYYGGESLKNTSGSQSLTCPLCGHIGFNCLSLELHVVTSHPSNEKKVICPLCASLPGPNSNLAIDDLYPHLSMHTARILREENSREISKSIASIALGTNRERTVPTNEVVGAEWFSIPSTSRDPLMEDLRTRFLSLITEDFELPQRRSSNLPKGRNLQTSTGPRGDTSKSIASLGMSLVGRNSNPTLAQPEQPKSLLTGLFAQNSLLNRNQLSPEHGRFIRELVISSFEQLSAEDKKNLLRDEALLKLLKSRFNIDLDTKKD